MSCDITHTTNCSITLAQKIDLIPDFDIQSQLVEKEGRPNLRKVSSSRHGNTDKENVKMTNEVIDLAVQGKNKEYNTRSCKNYKLRAKKPLNFKVKRDDGKENMIYNYDPENDDQKIIKKAETHRNNLKEKILTTQQSQDERIALKDISSS